MQNESAAQPLPRTLCTPYGTSPMHACTHTKCRNTCMAAGARPAAVAPAVQTDVLWTVTKPSGVEVELSGRSTRLGIVRARGGVLAD